MIQTYFDQATAISVPIRRKRIRISGSHTLPAIGNPRIVLDLSDYYVGYFSFSLSREQAYLDAPVRLKIRFCETREEIQDDYDRCSGTICASWLQEEVVTVDAQGRVKLPRRYACRYISVTVVAAPQPIRLEDFVFVACTSASWRVPALATQDEDLRRIDKISINTLKNCMQAYFEDGPKRDRRLWIGDLRLQALADYTTYKNYDLVKKCLFWLAAGERIGGGFLPPAVFLDRSVHSVNWLLIDYALLYTVAVCDYYEQTGDTTTAQALFELCRAQLDAARPYLDFKQNNQDRCHIDWCPGLKKNVALYGVYLYVLEHMITLAEALGYNDLARTGNKELIVLRDACFRRFYHPKTGLFNAAADDDQISLHTQCWMVLGKVGPASVRQNLMARIDTISFDKTPLTPYMDHYVAEAYVSVGMKRECLNYIKKQWGRMGEPDTYPEVFSPDDPDFSPYNDRKLNSHCHAWSCTPSYFIRTLSEP